MKRVVDLVVAAIGCVVALPIGLVLAVVILICDGAPVFYRSTRTGRGGRPFTMYKFRTMRAIPGSTDELSELAATWHSGVPDDFQFKSDVGLDPRVTRLGGLLRKSSLDELPQLFNVLRGDMSLVGPRPELPVITARYNDHQARRLEVRPGITGLAQASGRAAMTHGDKIRFDLEYVDQVSVRQDFAILGQTISAVCRRTGAV